MSNENINLFQELINLQSASKPMHLKNNTVSREHLAAARLEYETEKQRRMKLKEYAKTHGVP
jgi:hypothetical protein